MGTYSKWANLTERSDCGKARLSSNLTNVLVYLNNMDWKLHSKFESWLLFTENKYDYVNLRQKCNTDHQSISW